jgi:hypothetical protein
LHVETFSRRKHLLKSYVPFETKKMCRNFRDRIFIGKNYMLLFGTKEWEIYDLLEIAIQ